MKTNEIFTQIWYEIVEYLSNYPHMVEIVEYLTKYNIKL